ncbi:ATP-grasp domain-containing protein [Allohahella sp. A8]|uniref:ATP-grasp domain-containing protein n=1 Tax=Allohahella sp. A8 TaxID=3141461 RepID=UPI003A810793
MSMQKRIGIIHAYPSLYLVNSLANAGYRVVLFGNGRDFAVHEGVEAVIDVPLWDVEALDYAVRGFHAERPLDALLPVNEGTAVVTARLCEALGLRGLPVTAAIASRNKYLSYLLWEAQGVSVPPAFPVHDADSACEILDSELDGKGVIKLVDSMNSQGVIAAHSRETCREGVLKLLQMTHQSLDVDLSIDRNRFAYGRSALKLMVQHFCTGVEVSVDVFLMPDGDDRVLAILEKAPSAGPYFAETASIWPTSLSAEKEAQVSTLAIRAARSLGLHEGPAHVEIRYDHETPTVLEAGLRPGGGYTVQLIERLRKSNVYVAQAQLALGEVIPPLYEPEKQALLFGGIIYRSSGVLSHVDGLDLFETIPELEQLVILNKVGDQVRAMPESAQPHYCYYLLSGSSREKLVEIHNRIQSEVRLEIDLEIQRGS